VKEGVSRARAWASDAQTFTLPRVGISIKRIEGRRRGARRAGNSSLDGFGFGGEAAVGRHVGEDERADADRGVGVGLRVGLGAFAEGERQGVGTPTFRSMVLPKRSFQLDTVAIPRSSPSAQAIELTGELAILDQPFAQLISLGEMLGKWAPDSDSP
jgi:hypothetical protein